MGRCKSKCIKKLSLFRCLSVYPIITFEPQDFFASNFNREFVYLYLNILNRMNLPDKARFPIYGIFLNSYVCQHFE